MIYDKKALVSTGRKVLYPPGNDHMSLLGGYLIQGFDFDKVGQNYYVTKVPEDGEKGGRFQPKSGGLRRHVCFIYGIFTYMHLPYISAKCRQEFHTWSICDMEVHQFAGE